MTLIMYDSIQDNMPVSATCIAGYVGGNWPTATEYWFGRHKAAHKLTIAISAGERARCLDIERGDANPTEAPSWYRDKAERQWGPPVLYASASVAAEVIKAMDEAGISRKDYLLWSAHYGHGQHICGPKTCGYPQADATQWTDNALGRSLDESLCSSWFFPDERRPGLLRKVRRHRVVRRPALSVHPKVIGGGVGAASSAAVYTLLRTLKVHATPDEIASIATVLSLMVGYLVPNVTRR